MKLPPFTREHQYIALTVSVEILQPDVRGHRKYGVSLGHLQILSGLELSLLCYVRIAELIVSLLLTFHLIYHPSVVTWVTSCFSNGIIPRNQLVWDCGRE